MSPSYPSFHAAVSLIYRKETTLDIQIFTPDLTFCGVCDRVLSLTATESFDGTGECSLRIPLESASAFPPDGFLSLPGFGGGYRIESVTEDSRDGTSLVAGRSILSLFSHRALPDGFTYSGSAEDALTGLAADQGAAVLPGNLSCISYGIPQTVEVAARAGSLLDVMSSVARRADLGLHLRLDPTAGEFLFSVHQKKNGGRFLSRSLGNLLRCTRQQDLSAYANRVTVLGRGGKRITLSAEDYCRDGFDDASAPLREYLVSATDLLPSDYETEAAYLSALSEIGVRTLYSHRPRFSANLQVDESTAQAVMPGEICPLSDPMLGRYSAAVCTEKSLIADRDGARHHIRLSLIPNTQVS